MRILILSISHIWFDSRLYFRIVHSLLKHDNVKIKLITQMQKDNINLKCENFEKEILSSKLSKLQILKGFVKKGIEYKPDIVICIEPLTMISGYILKKKLSCRFIYDAHEFFAMAFKEKFYFAYNIYWKFEKFFASKTDAIITVNNELVNHLKQANKNTFLCANLPNKESFFLDTSHQEKKEYDLIYTGGLCFERGLLIYLKAASLLKKKKVDFCFAIIGNFFDKSTEEFFLNYIKFHRLENHIVFKNYMPVKDVLIEMRKAKLGVFMGDILKRPRLDKTLNMKLFEYISQGIPVIVNNSTVLKEFVENTSSGWVIPFNGYDLADLIINIKDKSDELAKKGGNAQKLLLSNYIWENQEEILFKAIFG